VIVVLPIHPAGDPKTYSIRYILKYTYESINRPGSIIYRLKAEFPNVNLSDYIGFFALRNWALLNNVPVTEQIYVHAKLMIVDDRIVITGSSNINDRSMLGTHDSELGIAIHSGEMVDSTMAGEPFKVSRFAHEMRMRLWRDYLGLKPDDNSIADPVCQVAYNDKWVKTAVENSKIYCKVFQMLPDTILSVEDMGRASIPQHGEDLNDVRGFLVEFPLNFLNTDKLPPIPTLSVFI